MRHDLQVWIIAHKDFRLPHIQLIVALIVRQEFIRELSLKQLRSSISIVMQDVFLFSDTINENVKLGKKEYIDAPPQN